MKIQLASDLHLEFLQRDWPGERVIGPVPGADVLVLAGDIADGAHGFKLFADWPTPQPTPIIYVAPATTSSMAMRSNRCAPRCARERP